MGVISVSESRPWVIFDAIFGLSGFIMKRMISSEDSFRPLAPQTGPISECQAFEKRVVETTGTICQYYTVASRTWHLAVQKTFWGHPSCQRCLHPFPFLNVYCLLHLSSLPCFESFRVYRVQSRLAAVCWSCSHARLLSSTAQCLPLQSHLKLPRCTHWSYGTTTHGVVTFRCNLAYHLG